VARRQFYNYVITDPIYTLEVLMKSAQYLLGAFCIAGVLTLGACKADVKTEATTGKDSTGMTVETAPAVKEETIQAKVSAALVAAPGFGGVDVTSTEPGVIVLNGTVKTEDEKAKAQMIASNVEGVKTVTNNLTVAP
jgi:osmotically-inducible protein OsmY